MKSKHLDRRLIRERIQDGFILPEVYAKYRKMVDASFPNLSEEEKDVETRVICHTHPDSPHVQKPAPDPKLQPGKPTGTQKLIAVLVAGVLILLQMVALLLAGLIYVLIFSDKAHAAGSGTSQIDVIKATDGTHTVVAAAPFKMSFSGCTVGGTGSAWTINCTGGAANPGGSAHQIQVNLSGTGFAGIDNGTAGQVMCSNGATLDPGMCDPIVSGPDAPGVAPTKNPVQIGLFDGTNVQRALGSAAGRLSVDVNSAPTTAVTGTFFQATQPVSTADGSQATLGSKADAKSTATDTTAITIMQVLKEISAMEQVPASRAVTNAGTFAVQAAQSGTWTVQPGNTANSTPWLFNINDGTNSLTAAMSAYGTAPTGTKVLGVNSFITNIPHFVCDSGCGGGSGGTSATDEASFTEGTTTFTPVGGYFQTSPTSLTSTHTGAVGMTATRHMFVNLPDALPAGTNVIGHVIADTGSTTAVTSLPAIPSGSNVIGHVIADSGSTTAVTSLPAIPAGTNLIGKAGFDNTTPGTTNGVSMAQPTRTTGTITTSSTSIPVATTGYGVATVTVNGTYAGITVNFEFSDDGGTTYYADTCTRTDTNVQESSEALPSNQSRAFDCGVFAATNFRVRSSAFTSGTANIGITLSAAPIEPAPTVSISGTVPVSGTVTTTPPSNASTNVAQLAGTTTDTNSGTKSGGTLRVVLATDQPALTNKLLVTPDSVALPANQSVNVSQVAGSTTSTAASGVQKVGIVGNAGAAVDAATGAAPPANAILHAGLGSGATNGFLVAVPVSDTYKAINISTATTTLLVTGVSGRQVRIGSLHMVTALANNVALIEGTGATCGTGSAGMAGGTTSASGYNFAANGGLTMGTGLGTVMQTATTGDSVCIVTSAATQLSGGLQYAIY